MSTVVNHSLKEPKVGITDNCMVLVLLLKPKEECFDLVSGFRFLVSKPLQPLLDSRHCEFSNKSL
jgi:hypothetical protein